MLDRWIRAVKRWRFIAIAIWVAIVIVGTISAVRLPALLTTSLAVPNTASQRADTLLAEHFADDTEGSFTIVYRVATPSARLVRRLNLRLEAAARAIPTAHALSLKSAPGILYDAINTKLDLERAATYTDALRRDLNSPGDPTARVTGEPAIQHDITPILASDLRRGEIIAVAVALILLLLVLGWSWAVLIPLIVASCTSTASIAIVYVVARQIPMALYVPNLVQFISLGLAVDYSLLIVHRFREEVASADRGFENALVRTMATAGRTVIFSGFAVAIGLSAILITPIPFIRSLGVAGCVVPLVSVAAALTLQPALLSLFGSRGIQKVRIRGRELGRDPRPPLSSRVAQMVTRRPASVLACSVGVLVVAAIPLAWLQTTPGSIAQVPRNTGSALGLTLLGDSVGPGVITPIDVVIDTGVRGGARSPATTAATLRLARELLRDREAYIVAIGSRPPYVDASGRYGHVVVVARQAFSDGATRQLVSDLRLHFVPDARFPSGTHLYAGGAPAEAVDFLARLYGTFPWVIGIVLALACLVMLSAFRSIVLAFVAVLLDAVSVAATYGLLVVVFRFGVGRDLFGLYRVSQIEAWVPVFLFALLFGLSMDYEFFFVRRMREAFDGGADTAHAVSEGLERTGRIVTVAALIMVGALAGLVAGHVADLQELGAGLALGVLLDATIVRGLLLPSLMTLLGRWCWWLPAPMARLARIGAPPSQM